MFRARRRVSLFASFAVLALGAATACDAATTEGEAVGVAVDKVAGFEVTHFESGLKEGAPAPDETVENLTGSLEDRLAVATIADLNDFWGKTMPAEFGMKFKPVSRLISYDSRSDSVQTKCGTIREENAFFCPPGDTVAWDRGVLLPKMTSKYGPISPVTVLAHEYGHAVQHRLGEKAGKDNTTPTIVAELQADCFTGSYFRWVVEESSAYIRVSTAEGLNSALSSLYFVRDQPGKLQSDLGAHGTAFDRTFAFQEGFETGAKECAGYDRELIKQRTTQQKFSEHDSGKGELPITEENLGLLKESLDAAFSGDGGPEITASGGGCDGGAGTPPASYCADSNAVSVDIGALSQIGRPIDIQAERQGQDAQGKGDFAAWASVASRYALGVQRAGDLAIDDARAGLRTACLVGSWAGAANQPREVEKTVRLSPGDVDEAILEMLQPESLIASNAKGDQVPSGFLRIEAFRVGYNNGPDTCGSTYR